MEPIEESVDAYLCPFCRAENNCMAYSKEPCWCFEITIPTALQELIPESSKGKSCICLACINAYQESPENFALDKNLSTNK